MIIFRIMLYSAIICAFCWLTWWVLPYVAFIRLEDKGLPLPNSGLVLINFQQSTITGYRVVVAIRSGWSTLWSGWPCTLFGLLIGLGAGYVIGERARRQFAIDQASQDAITTAKEYETSATLKLLHIKHLERQLEKKNRLLSNEMTTLKLLQDELNTEQHLIQNKSKKFESAELNKALMTIQKLERKLAQAK